MCTQLLGFYLTRLITSLLLIIMFNIRRELYISSKGSFIKSISNL